MDVRRFTALAPEERRVVFYAENRAAWPHLAPIVRALIETEGVPVCYLTSDRGDPRLAAPPSGLRAFYVSEGIMRTHVFWTLVARVMVTTTPDLETFHLKRSRRANVHYVYVHHSLVSMHTVYRKSAFDHFDAICCAGPHHAAETRAMEQAYGLPKKTLVEHGYGCLDALLERTGDATASSGIGEADRPPRVLVAPSWGPDGLLETHAEEVTAALLDSGCEVTVRPHPVTIQKSGQIIAALSRRYGNAAGFHMETSIASHESFARADVMISDWSGAALEYAFGFERPVLFVDVPPKINNPDHDRVGLEPIEQFIRPTIGEVIEPREIHQIGARVLRLRECAADFVPGIREARRTWVFNVGASGPAAAKYIARAAASNSAHQVGTQ